MKKLITKKVITTTHTTFRLLRFPLWFLITNCWYDDCCCEITTLTSLFTTNNNGASASSSYGTTTTDWYGGWEWGEWYGAWNAWGCAALPGGRRTLWDCACYSLCHCCCGSGDSLMVIHITIIVVLIIKQGVLVLVGAWIDAVTPIRIHILEVWGIAAGDLQSFK